MIRLCPMNFGDCVECGHHDPSDGACMFATDECLNCGEMEGFHIDGRCPSEEP